MPKARKRFLGCFTGLFYRNTYIIECLFDCEVIMKAGKGVLKHRKSIGYVKQPTVERIDEILKNDYENDIELGIFATSFVNWYTAKYHCSMTSAYRMMNLLENVYDYNFIRWFYG
jgi:hypothetical protein